MFWRQKACLITGGSAGLGLALAREAAARGASVVVCGRSADQLEAAACAIREHGHRVVAVAADVTQDDDCRRLADAAMSEFGGVDMLANCAGASSRARILDADANEFQRLWELNLLAPVRLTRMLGETLIKRRGHIVNIGSLASKAAPKFLGAYPATKFALAAYTQQLRIELGPQGLHALLVCPGPIARADAGRRYHDSESSVPDIARQPGAGAKLNLIDVERLARKIFHACEKRRAELVVPNRARLLFALAQLSPSLGDWLLRKTTTG